jgi:uncharacterized protein (TIGR02594 family)
MFQKAGHPEVKDDETAWCSAAVNCWMVESGLKGTGNLLARSWLKWGKAVPLNKPLSRGTILIFPRGNIWQGHVAILVEERPDGTVYYIGGNQSNSVSINRSHKSRLIGARWPNTVRNSVTIKAGAVGTTSFAGAEGLDKVADHSDKVSEALSMGQDAAQTISTISTYGSLLLVALAFASIGYMIYRHYKRNIQNVD